MGKFRNFSKKIALTIFTKCCLHQILDETNVKGCENGVNICKFTKDIYWKQLENKQELKRSRFLKWNNCIN